MLMSGFFKKILGDPQVRTIKRLRKRAELVNALEPKYKKMSDKVLRTQTEKLKNRLKKESLDKRIAIDYSRNIKICFTNFGEVPEWLNGAAC